MENLGIPPFLGTTPPISYNMPEPVDIKATSDLKMCLENHDAYETLEGQANREVALKCLHQLLVDWVQIVGNRKRIKSEYLVDGGGVQLRVYGSQRLGVHSPAADIDVLCIAPYFITREDFFTDLCGILREKSKLSDGLSNMYSSSNKKSCNALDDKSFDVSFVTPIPEAYTPVIKFCLNEQSIDMIFVSLTENVCKVPIPPTIDILDIQYVRGLDDKGIRSINGCRVTERILQLVPDVEVFCMALRTIKLWARNRGIYSNVLGFLGGVNYAILVAFICQRYINASPSMIVRTFFKFYCQWRWPHAILLTPIEDKSAQIMGINVDSDKPDDPLAAAIANGAVPSVWNPKTNPRDGTQLMPIITPCYPSMNRYVDLDSILCKVSYICLYFLHCSAYNVGLPQFRLLQKEIQRGQNIMVRGIISGATPVPVPVFAPASTSGPVPLPVPVPPLPLPQAYPMAPHISPCNPALISAGNSTSAKENSNRPINHWELLLAPATTEFFQRHCRYIQIDISANSPLQQRVWFGWCESRLRSLTTSLEQVCV